MFIKTQETGSPHELTFLPGREILPSGRVSFATAGEAARAPLARRLLEQGDVEQVTLGSDSILVRKAQGADWAELKPALLVAIMNHFTAGEPVVLDDATPAPAQAASDDPIVVKIRELIETRIKTVVAKDGGAVVFHDFKDGDVVLEFQGSAYRLVGGIENLLRHYVPEVVNVVDYLDTVSKPGLDTPEGQAIRQVLQDEVNPSVASHGGHISLIDVIGDTAYIRLEGGCQGCGMANVTLKQGVEVQIKKAVPTIARVLDTTDHASGSNPYYRG